MIIVGRQRLTGNHLAREAIDPYAGSRPELPPGPGHISKASAQLRIPAKGEVEGRGRREMPEPTNAAAPATAADIMRPPLTTVVQQDHVAGAAYLMKHAGTTALMVLDTQTGQPIGIITEADIAHAVADGKD